jgi:hypothetical protein
LLVDDTINRDYLMVNPQATTVDTFGDIELHESRGKFDTKKRWHESDWPFYMNKGPDSKLKARVRIHHRVYSLHELRTLLERAGWRYIKSYGEFDLTPFAPDSNRIIACCRA